METLLTAPAHESFVQSFEAEQSPIQWHPTKSQRLALSRLHQLANVFSKVGDNRLAGFRPACRLPLVIGSSGAGKTSLIAQFAQERKLPLLQVDAGSWLVAGSIAKPGTLRLIRDFIRANSNREENNKNPDERKTLDGVLYLDEACKLLPRGESLNQSSWSLSVFAEATGLLSADGRLATHEWSSEDIANLRERYILVGGAAFQSALADVREAQRKGGLGFGGSKKEASHEAEIAKHLPEELLSRFSEIIVLETPTREDFQDAIDRIHSTLGIKRQRPLKELLDEAMAAAGGMRWAEKYVCTLIVEHPYCVRPTNFPREKTQPTKNEARSFDLLVGDVPRCLAGANSTIAQLNTKLSVIYSKLHVMSQEAREKPWTGMLANPELGEAIIRTLRSCQLLTTVTADDREEITTLVDWRMAAWKTLTENAMDLAHYGLTDAFSEAWALAGALVEYRASLNRAVQRGLLG